MLDLNPETVCFVIRKAHQFHAKEEVVLPEEPLGPGDSSTLQVLADHTGDETFTELRTTINDLEPDQQVELVALMWLGRGDYDLEEWEAALEQARDSWNTHTAEYLIATPLVSDYLEEGLSLHGYSCE
jgi:hypothetical protein